MFPIIPQHLLKQNPAFRGATSGGTSAFDNCEFSDQIGGSITLVHLHQGCVSRLFSPKELDLVSTFNQNRASHSLACACYRLSTKGLLKSDKNLPEWSWVEALPLSNDIHSANVVLEVAVSGDHLQYRIVKEVSAGQPLWLWFSEQISALMSIPFLRPINIKGNNCYACHLCHNTFEYPNPLKIHLATVCHKYSRQILWSRLKNALQPTTPHNLNVGHHILTANDMRRQTPTAVSTATTMRPSAFRPVTATSTTNARPPKSSSTILMPHSNALAAAHLETIVSNMGASKQGQHLCIYCGKTYSRKYGLKIHIRTHTGFKPLKCKYCLRPFGDPSNLNKHVRLHAQGTTIYKCHLCDKVLVRRRDLQRHVQSRHSDGSAHRGQLSTDDSSSDDGSSTV